VTVPTGGGGTIRGGNQSGRLCRVEIGGPIPGETLTGLSALSPASFDTPPRQKLIVQAPQNALRIRFKGSWQVDNWVYSNASVEIWGLSPEHQEFVANKNAPVALYTGWDNGQPLIPTLIFPAYHVSTTHDGPDFITKLEGGDGGRAAQEARTNKSHAPGVNIFDVAKGLLGMRGKMGANSLATLQAAAGNRKLNGGYVSVGKATRQVKGLMDELGLDMTVWLGNVVLTPKNGTTGSRFLLTPDSGLVGSPGPAGAPQPQLPQQWKTKILLNPLIGPGSQVQVQADALNGAFRCQTVDHHGDTYDTDWYTDLTLRRI